MEQTTGNKIAIIKNIYFYLVSFVALMMMVFSLADLINIALKTWVFTKADKYPYYGLTECAIPVAKPTSATDAKVSTPTPEECAKQEEEYQKREEQNRAAERQRDAVRDISMIVVGIPLFAIHWSILRKKEV